MLLKRIELPAGWHEALIEARRRRLALDELSRHDLDLDQAVAAHVADGLGGPGALPQVLVMPGSVPQPRKRSGNGHSSSAP